MSVFNKETALQFYSVNVVEPLEKWNLLSDSEVVDGHIKLYSKGYAGVKLTETLGHGLTQSKYRYLQVKVIIPEISDSFNYTSYADIVLSGSYILNGNTYYYYHSIPITKMEASIAENGEVYITRCLTMGEYNFENLEVYIKNHTDATIYLKLCSLLRSCDVSTGQIINSINQSAGLISVTAYSDGFSILYNGMDTKNPLKIWWVEDETGKLSGLNVNNERFISFFDCTSEVLS